MVSSWQISRVADRAHNIEGYSSWSCRTSCTCRSCYLRVSTCRTCGTCWSRCACRSCYLRVSTRGTRRSSLPCRSSDASVPCRSSLPCRSSRSCFSRSCWPRGACRSNGCSTSFNPKPVIVYVNFSIVAVKPSIPCVGTCGRCNGSNGKLTQFTLRSCGTSGSYVTSTCRPCGSLNISNI